MATFMLVTNEKRQRYDRKVVDRFTMRPNRLRIAPTSPLCGRAINACCCRALHVFFSLWVIFVCGGGGIGVSSKNIPFYRFGVHSFSLVVPEFGSFIYCIFVCSWIVYAVWVLICVFRTNELFISVAFSALLSDVCCASCFFFGID